MLKRGNGVEFPWIAAIEHYFDTMRFGFISEDVARAIAGVRTARLSMYRILAFIYAEGFPQYPAYGHNTLAIKPR